jgi:hypothetical protein
MRALLIAVLLAGAPCAAQDLPDPGRRLSKEEQAADPDKPHAAPAPRGFDARSPERPHDAKACEGARRLYQMSCRAPNSFQSRSMDCAEAYAVYRQNCP